MRKTISQVVGVLGATYTLSCLTASFTYANEYSDTVVSALVASAIAGILLTSVCISQYYKD